MFLNMFLIKFFLIYAFISTENAKSDKALNQAANNKFTKFETKIVPNEFIVIFRNYYQAKTRAKYLKSAFDRVKISDWKILSRENVAAYHPSDFDVVFVNDPNLKIELIHHIKTHPAIKNVTPHRNFRRNIQYEKYNYSVAAENNNRRKLLKVLPVEITKLLKANDLWNRGITGHGVKVAVFDTGLVKNHPHFKLIKERTNWTNEKTLEDGVSHGTFVAGVIASSQECLGIAPDVELHIYRVFTNAQVSYTSWFLDAFNYAMFRKINVVNLSIGGPDFLDYPFVDKVLELSANKVIMVSAIGNDGPYYGTLNNPGDQSDVIGVGGINFEEKIAKFSSRGMTTWELPSGYGRLKPDIVTFGNHVKGSDVRKGCRSLSGTSVASPIVAGAIALIISGALNKIEYANPASIKQVLIEGADQLLDINMFEQGYGKLNIPYSMDLFSSYEPKVTLSPPYLDFTNNYMWPYSSQPLFCGSMPIIVNVTILNGISVSGKVKNAPLWYPYIDKNGDLLNIEITYSSILWPWSGWISLLMSVNNNACEFEGLASGHIELIVENQSFSNDSEILYSKVIFPINIKIISKPPRQKRILWDQYHNLRYPPGYIPRDNLKIKTDPLDWRADHIHTNFKDMYSHLRNAGYYVDVLRTPYTCFNASEYGTLLIVDSEEEFSEEEINKIRIDVYNKGLSIIMFSDWYNTTVMKKIKFFDENTRQWWIPDTGGANIPAINDLLRSFDIALSDKVAEGHFKLGDHKIYYASGATIAKFPNNTDSIVVGFDLNDQGIEFTSNSTFKVRSKQLMPILGLFQPTLELQKKYLLQRQKIQSSYESNNFDKNDFMGDKRDFWDKNPIKNKRILLDVNTSNIVINLHSENLWKNTPVLHKKDSKIGRVAIFGDSDCLDSVHTEKDCFWLLDALLEFTMNSHKSELLEKKNMANYFRSQKETQLPLRLANSNLHKYSKILDSNDKFNKLPIAKCQMPEWTIKHPVNYSKFNHPSNKIVKLNNEQDQKQVNRMEGPSSYEYKYLDENPAFLLNEKSLHFSIFFLIMLTIIVLIIFFKFSRKKISNSLYRKI